MATALRVDLRTDGIEIDGRFLAYPILLSDLAETIEEEPMTIPTMPDIRINGSWTWRKSGMSAWHKNEEHVSNFWIDLDGHAHEVTIEGKPYGDVFGPRGSAYEFDGIYQSHRTDPGPDQHVDKVGFEVKTPRRKKKAIPKTKPVEFAPVDDAVEFTDLNVKLLVVQELMYRKKLLTPAFDLTAFLRDHVEREVDVEDEGYDPIPEALDYFSRLPVPRALLAEVEDIYMDGGNAIYMQIAPLWGGEDDFFDVADFSDVDLLPNLRTMKLFGVDYAAIDGLRAKGIDADWL